eukprot:COSAG02_NODE_3610_length_6484_cov_2.117269_6_plen_238_part_00
MGMVFGKVSEETPAFELLKQAQSYQVRQYVPSVSAETTYVNAGGLDENTSQAFRRLAQYIGVFSTPQNRNAGGDAEPVAMTAPVLMAPPGAQAITGSPSAAPSASLDESVTAGLTMGARSGPRTMAFLLPSKYTKVEEAPVPVDSAVKLRQLPSRTQAVNTFTWSLKEANVAAHLEALVTQIEADPEWCAVITENGEPEWCAAGYNAPFTIPFMRTNEVMVTVRRRNSDQAQERARH